MPEIDVRFSHRAIPSLILKPIQLLAICFGLAAFKSDCEPVRKGAYIDGAIKYYISALQFKSAGSTRKNEIIYLDLYNSVEEFHALNPDCCTFKLNGDGGLPPAWFRFKYNYAGRVTIKYRKKQMTQRGYFLYGPFSVDVLISKCAQPLNEFAKGKFR